MTARLDTRFATLKAQGKAGFIPYIMAGDPDLATTRDVLLALPEAGADIIELGFPFTDPTADGATIAAAGQRALHSGTRLADVLGLVAEFRAKHPDTPLILMGYANPIANMSEAEFAKAAAQAGVDGVIVVDLPPEEDESLRSCLTDSGLSLIRLVTPTTKGERLAQVLEHASGFVYTVSSTGVTGSVNLSADTVQQSLDLVRGVSDLPVAVGFGVRTGDDAARIAQLADAVVVGSAIVDALHTQGPNGALDLVRHLAEATHGAKNGVVA